MTDNTQSEALDLADWLDWCGCLTSKSAAAELRRQHAELETQLAAIGAGGVTGPLIGQPQAMPDLTALTERGAKAWAGVDAQGLRDGGASPSANAGEPFGWVKQSEIDSSKQFGGSINLWRRRYDCDVPVYLAAPPTAQAEGWTKASKQLPPCRGDQLYIGVNSAGYAGVFNAVASIAGNVHCMYETPEETIDVMSDLSIWKPFTPPTSAEGWSMPINLERPIMTHPTPHGQVPAIQRYKIGYHSDDWGQRSSTPSGIPDASGSWVRYADHVAALAAGQAVAPAKPDPTPGDHPPPCDSELFESGVSVGLFDIPKWTAEALCKGIAAATGARIDWHYIGGRVHVKALPAPPAMDASPSAASTAWSALRDLTDPLGEAGTKIMGHARIYAQRQYEAGRAPHGQAPAGATNTKTHELLSTTVGLLMGYREGAARQPYKPGSVIDKTVAEAVEHLKDWPYPEPTPAAQAAESVLEDAARLDFLIEQRAYVVSDPDACPGCWLHFVHKETGKCLVQIDEHPTPRAAIDAAMAANGGNK